MGHRLRWGQHGGTCVVGRAGRCHTRRIRWTHAAKRALMEPWAPHADFKPSPRAHFSTTAAKLRATNPHRGSLLDRGGMLQKASGLLFFVRPINKASMTWSILSVGLAPKWGQKHLRLIEGLPHWRALGNK